MTSSSDVLRSDLWCINLHRVAYELGVEPIVTATALRYFRLTIDTKEAQNYEPSDLLSASIYLAARVCESPIRLAHVIPLCAFAETLNSFIPLSTAQYFTKRKKVLEAETVVLMSIGFRPIPCYLPDLLFEMLKACTANKEWYKLALNLMFDILCSNLSTECSPAVICVVALSLSNSMLKDRTHQDIVPLVFESLYRSDDSISQNHFKKEFTRCARGITEWYQRITLLQKTQIV